MQVECLHDQQTEVSLLKEMATIYSMNYCLQDIIVYAYQEKEEAVFKDSTTKSAAG